MSGLQRRLTALEEIAEDLRLRPIRQLAQERGIAFETLRRRYDECRARTKALRAQGFSDEQILALSAQRLGITPDALRAGRDQLAEHFNLSA